MILIIWFKIFCINFINKNKINKNLNNFKITLNKFKKNKNYLIHYLLAVKVNNNYKQNSKKIKIFMYKKNFLMSIKKININYKLFNKLI